MTEVPPQGWGEISSRRGSLGDEQTWRAVTICGPARRVVRNVVRVKRVAHRPLHSRARRRTLLGTGEIVLANRTFEQWVDDIFDHPVNEPAWFWNADADTCEKDDETNVEYLARLFADSDRLLRRFDNSQVNQGLNMIVEQLFTVNCLPLEDERLGHYRQVG